MKMLQQSITQLLPFLTSLSVPLPQREVEAERVKIFTFKEQTDDNDLISFVKLTSPLQTIETPSKFTFCMSHLESHINGKNFYTILGKDKKPWLSMSIWFRTGSPTVWAQYGNKWLKILAVRQLRLNFWIHTCTYVDVDAGKLKFLLKGEDLVSYEIVCTKANDSDRGFAIFHANVVNFTRAYTNCQL